MRPVRLVATTREMGDDGVVRETEVDQRHWTVTGARAVLRRTLRAGIGVPSYAIWRGTRIVATNV